MKTLIKAFTELTKEELYEIMQIRNAVFVVEQNCPYQDCDGKDIGAYHLFMRDQGRIIAYLRILNRGISYDEVSIGRVLMCQDYRRQGLGKILMQSAIDYVEQTMKEKEIRISAQLYLLEFYKALGFKEVSDVYLEDDIPHIEMLYTRD